MSETDDDDTDAGAHEGDDDETAEQPTIYSTIYRAVGTTPDNRTADEVADKVLADLGTPEPWKSLFHPLVRYIAHNYQRDVARREERKHLTRPSRPAHGGAKQEARHKGLPPTFSLDGYEGVAHQWLQMPDGRRIKWGDATGADHLSRLSWLEQQSTAISRTAAQHRALVEALQAVGVDTLFELIARYRKGSAA